MKNFYLPLAASMCAMSLFAAEPTITQLVGNIIPSSKCIISNDDSECSYSKVKKRATVDEIFAAPENTVLDGPYTSECTFSGYQNSDLGRPGMPTRFYQAFHGCYKTVNALRVIGMFNYFDKTAFDWFRCDSRGGMQPDNTLTAPVNFEVSFYREDENGEPGELVFREHFDIVGRYLGIDYGMEGNMSPLYEFKVDLGKEINLECGFMSFTATDMGDSPECWFSLFTAATSLDFGLIDLGESRIPATNPCVFSFMGDGKMAAQKALRLDAIQAPVSGAAGTHEKVTAKLINVGEQAINDARLELWVDGTHIATEDVYATIPAGGSYTYTFMQRADISAVGEHKVVIKNVTPGDEKISREMIVATTYVTAEGEYCTSKSLYEDELTFISKISVGDLENTSANDHYADYYDTKELHMVPGEIYTLSMEPMLKNIAGVWIDWNNNGSFNDEGEHIGYIYDLPLDFSIPTDFPVKAGKKRMRIVLDNSNAPRPCGEYYYGETEDYGVVVERNSNTPAMEIGITEISEKAENAIDTPSVCPFDIANTGNANLDANLSVEYALPIIYDEPRNMTPASQFNGKLAAAPVAAKVSEPQVDASVKQVLRYDGGFDIAVGVGNYADAVFAQCFPANVIQTVKGMQLSSVDVYLYEITGQKASVKIFGQGTNGQAGALLAEKEFTPVAESWNHIELDTPVTLDGTDIWYGVELHGMSQGKYYIGIDNKPANAGYGDLCQVDNYWWSMAELGINHNFCVRANLTGERTAAINWLSVDKNSVTVAPGETAKINASLNGSGLNKAVYEAKIKITSNDELSSISYIPVYLTNGTAAGIDSTELTKTTVRVVNGQIIVESDEEIANVAAYDMSGRMTANNDVASNCISLDHMAAGIYVVKVVYVDGSAEAFKVAVIR